MVMQCEPVKFLEQGFILKGAQILDPLHSTTIIINSTNNLITPTDISWVVIPAAINQQTINTQSSIGVLLLNAIDALHYAEILPVPVVFNCEEASGIHVFGVYIHNEMLHVFQLGLPVVVVGE